MKTRKVSKSGIELTEIGFGTASIAGLYRPCLYEQAMDVLETAWNSGIRYYDTAPFYGMGLAERRVGDFLRDKPVSEWALSTKVGRLFETDDGSAPTFGYAKPLPFKFRYDYSYDAIMRSIEHSFLRLGLNKIDIAYVHDIGMFTHGREVNETYLRQLLDGGVKALEELKSAGVIKAFGLGVNEIDVCNQVMDHVSIDCILLAGRHTLLDRTAEQEFLPRCVKENVSIISGGVFNSGILATGPTADAHFDYAPASDEVLQKVRIMEELAQKSGRSLAQYALQFPLRHQSVSSLLLGTAKSKSLVRNLDLLKDMAPEEEFVPFNAHTITQHLSGDVTGLFDTD